MALISVALSIFLRKKISLEFNKKTEIIEISKEDLDDLVEYIDDKICTENINDAYNKKIIEVPNSFSGIIFGIKHSQNVIGP